MKNDAKIHPQALALNIGYIELQPLIEIEVAAAADLPEAGDSGYNLQSRSMPQPVGLGRERGRPRTDQAHIAKQNIEQLRQLIQARLAQDLPNSRNPGI